MDTSSLPVALETPSLFDNRGFIAGKWRHASSDKTFPVLEPSTGQILAHCADFSTQDFVEAIETADAEFKQFSSTTTAKQRGTILRKWNDLILENSQDS
jgi:succinate-semialdehyde dehydrogenase/glutarate-semialdehyde dehydrogenase